MQIRLLEQFQGQASYTDTAANTDFAVITLAEPVGKKTGWMGLTYSTAADEAVDITTAGEPHAVVLPVLQLDFLNNSYIVSWIRGMTAWLVHANDTLSWVPSP